MWKVKREYRAHCRLTIAAGTGGIAHIPVEPTSLPARAGCAMQTVDVLVKADIGLGQSVKPEDMQWQSWPAATAKQQLRSPQRPA